MARRLLLLISLIVADLVVTLPLHAGIGPVIHTARDTIVDFSELVERLADKRVVYLGEQHDRYDHHLFQLEVARALHAQGRALAIGVEWFDQSVQGVLDEYLAGAIDEPAMLDRTDYYRRWGYDFRMLRPVLRFARDRGLPVLALNAPRELTERIGREGIDSLLPAERAQLPAELDFSNQAYDAFLRGMLEQHDGARDFERFRTVQIVWDETMAQNAADFLRERPESRMLVIAGAGHLIHRYGIPDRVARRVPGLRTVVLLNVEGDEFGPDAADFRVATVLDELPPTGKMGVVLHSGDLGVRVDAVTAASGAEVAGILPGDRITQIDGRTVRRFADVKAILADRPPGETVTVELSRRELPGGETQTLRLAVELH
ncbi:MAG: ChaN family lipoprotein [Chromatiales bacterium]|nr:ChaN family lipoprotein [Chromatiales bacterium]